MRFLWLAGWGYLNAAFMLKQRRYVRGGRCRPSLLICCYVLSRLSLRFSKTYMFTFFPV